MKPTFFRALIATAATCLALAPGWASALPITKTVNVSVYQLCDDAGVTCAATGPAGNDYYADATNAIWAQAGISVTFSFVSQIFSSHFLEISQTSGDDFSSLHSLYGTHGPSNTSVDMFLVNDIAGAFGAGWSGQGGLMMDMQAIMDFSCGGAPGCSGRIDTLAHELGHNFGLVDIYDPDNSFDLGDPGHSSNPNQLMASGGTRHVPTTLADISPDGLGYDQLSAYQVTFARQSGLLRDVVVSTVPEPGNWALMAVALLGLGAARRHRAA